MPTTKRKTTKRVAARPAAREGSKSEKVFDLLKRKEGATIEEMMKATGWQAHSVRGFLAGTVVKRTGAKVASTKGEDGVRRYSID